MSRWIPSALIATLALCSLAVGQQKSKPTKKSEIAGIMLEIQTASGPVVVTLDNRHLETRSRGKLISRVALGRLEAPKKLKTAAGKYFATVRKLVSGKASTQAIASSLVGPSRRAELGVSVTEPGPALTAQLGVDPKKCVIVIGTTKGRAAQVAGIRRHDIILSINGSKPVTRSGLSRLIKTKKPGETIHVQLMRGGEKLLLPVILGSNTVSSANTGIRFPVENLAVTAQKRFARLAFDPLILRYNESILPVKIDTGKAKPTGVVKGHESLGKQIEALRADLRRLEKLLRQELQRKE